MTWTSSRHACRHSKPSTNVRCPCRVQKGSSKVGKRQVLDSALYASSRLQGFAPRACNESVLCTLYRISVLPTCLGACGSWRSHARERTYFRHTYVQYLSRSIGTGINKGFGSSFLGSYPLVLVCWCNVSAQIEQKWNVKSWAILQSSWPPPPLNHPSVKSSWKKTLLVNKSTCQQER